VIRLTRYVSPNHLNTIIYVNWYRDCYLLLLKSDLVELCKVLVEEKCSKYRWKS